MLGKSVYVSCVRKEKLSDGISVSLKTPTSVAQIKCMTKNKHTTNS